MTPFVSETKIRSYLLTHPTKAGIFARFGYVDTNWTRLRDDLLLIANSFPYRLRQHTPLGDEYEIVGTIAVPAGQMVSLRTGWFVRSETIEILRFTTAYPNRSGPPAN